MIKSIFKGLKGSPAFLLTMPAAPESASPPAAKVSGRSCKNKFNKPNPALNRYNHEISGHEHAFLIDF
ncbi:MAG: hypothetical protein ACNS62_06880 [Candidatus Cyclobacteriaceae bacterium M3_2C_046]